MNKQKESIRKRSIRTRFIIWFFAISIIPLLVVTFIIQKINSDILIEKEKQSLLGLVETKAESVDQWFNAQMSEMEIAAKSDVMKSMEADNIIPYLQMLEARSDVFETMFTIDPNGTVIAHSMPESVGSDYSDRAYVPKALNGESNYSDVLVSKATGNRIVVAATPIENDEGEVVGVLAGSANFEILVNTLLTLDEEDRRNVELTLLDSQGVVQVSPIEEILGVQINETQVGSDLTTVLNNSLVERGISTVNLKNEKYLYASAPISSVGYGLNIEIPEKDILSETSAIFISSYIIIGITLSADYYFIYFHRA